MNEFSNVTANDIAGMTIAQLKCVAAANNIELGQLKKKTEILNKISETLFTTDTAPEEVMSPKEQQGNTGAQNEEEVQSTTEDTAGSAGTTDSTQPPEKPQDDSDEQEKKQDSAPPTAEGLEVARVLKVTKPLMHGDDVKALQAALIANNYHCGVEGIDGVYAKNTAYAVRCFQAAHGLIVDGRAGCFTITTLGGKWTGEKIKLQISET